VYPACISCACFVVRTLAGGCFCAVGLGVELVPCTRLVGIPDGVCLVGRGWWDSERGWQDQLLCAAHWSLFKKKLFKYI